MTKSFIVALKPFLVLSKFFGIISITYTFESGLLIKNSINMIYNCLELMRMIILICFTYTFHVNNTFVFRDLVLFKFWSTVIMAKVFQTSIIKLINGIIEFDRTLDEFPLAVLGELNCSTMKYSWNIFLVTLLMYYISLQIFSIWLWPPKRFNFSIIAKYFFEIPCITEFVIFATTYFYLQNLGFRFAILNRFSKRLHDDLVTAAGTWTQSEITQLIENVRLLHAELCELLHTFSLGYGVLMLIYFVFNFLDILRNLYYMLHVSRYSSSKTNIHFSTLNIILTIMFCLQNVIFVLLLLITVSWINRKKMEIVSFLRLIHISKLPFDTKLQIKMFMNQLSTFEWDQITAFGYFNIDLRYIVSFFILLTTTLATSVQMKQHPYVIKFNNAYNSYLKVEYLNMDE